MNDGRTLYATEYEIEQLREEIKHLREEREHPPESDQHKQDEKKEEEKKDDKPHTLRNTLLIVGGVAILAVAVLWWLHARNFESTDDAQVDGHISSVSARVAGTVVAVYVEENQFVKAGQVLVDLDPRDLKAETSLARSKYLEAQAQARAEQPNVPVAQVTTRTDIAAAGTDVAGAEAGVAAAQRDYEAAQAKVREADANRVKAESDVERFRPLAQKDEIPQQQFDQVVATAKAMEATESSAKASAESALKQVDQRRAQLNQARERLAESQQNAPYQVAIREANVASKQSSTQAARAQLETAQLNESYTKIVAPVDGIIAKRSVEVGQRLTPGQQILLITQLDDLWVTANFRETQIRRMHPGQSVRTHIDALNLDFDSYIDSMPAGSGAITSLLPPENATGNFVKVVQRLPMRIRLKPNQPGLDRLRPGMSAEPNVALD